MSTGDHRGNLLYTSLLTEPGYLLISRSKEQYMKNLIIHLNIILKKQIRLRNVFVQVKEGKRLKEFLEDYDDDRDDPKYYR